MAYVGSEKLQRKLQQQPGLFDRCYFSRVLAPLDTTNAAALAQTVVIVVLALAAGYLLAPLDPLGLGSSFSWFGLLCTLLALRYGTAFGLFAALLVLVDWWFFYYWGNDSSIPNQFFIGLFLQTAVAGYLRDVWVARTRRAGYANQSLNNRLASLSSNYYLLQLSHDRLEKDLLSKPSTLRHAISQLRAATVVDRPGTSLPNIQELMEFVALNCQISEACVFPVTDYGFGHRAEAFLGERFELDSNDPLVVDSLKKRALSHLREIELGTSSYLACAPIVTSTDDILGLLVVQRMPFMALNHDNLQLLLVLLGYYADGVEQRPLVDKVRSRVADSPYDLSLELARMTRLRRVSGIRSTLIAFVAPKTTVNESMFAQILRERRTLDLSWAITTANSLIMVALLPLTDSRAAGGYVVRAENILAAQFSTSFSDARIAVHSVDVSSGEPGSDLAALLEICHGLS